MKDKQNRPEELKTSRRKLLSNGVAVSTLPIVAAWNKPIINAVVTPAHAQTSDAVAPEPAVDPAPAPAPAPPPPPAPAAAESFSLSVSPGNGPASQGAQFFVSEDGGTFTIEIFTDGQNTDFAPRINSAVATSVGTFVANTFSGCANDGSTGAPIPSNQGIQIVAHIPGVSVELQYERDSNTFVLPLDANAAPPTCPIN